MTRVHILMISAINIIHNLYSLHSTDSVARIDRGDNFGTNVKCSFSLTGRSDTKRN